MAVSNGYPFIGSAKNSKHTEPGQGEYPEDLAKPKKEIF
jgi:hypothetical protein